MIDKTHRPQRRADVRSETVEGEIVLYDPQSSRAVYLNQTAALIWNLCDGAASIEEISELLQSLMLLLADHHSLSFPCAPSRGNVGVNVLG